MVKKLILAVGIVLAFAACAAAQVDVRGQILLPDGNLPQEPIRFYFTSDDGRVNEIRFTDSNGRFILERLSARFSYTISVDTDNRSYGNTRYSFIPGYEQAVRLMLNPLPENRRPPTSTTVSVASSYRPTAESAAAYDKAMKEVKNERYGAAEPLFRQAIAADPKYVAAYNDLGVLYMQQKKYAEAEKVLRQATEIDPKSVHALLNLGITLNHLQKYTEAIPELREVIRLEAGLVAAHQHLAVALVETDQFKEAEQELLRVSKPGAADEAMTQLYLGKLYARTGNFEKSVAAFTSYLEKAPNAPNAAEVRGLIERMKREMSARK